MVRFALSFAMMVGAIAGCGHSVVKRADPVAVHGTVRLPGNVAVKGLFVTLHPTAGDGFLMAMPLGASGEFKGNAFPGQYTYYISPPESGPSNIKAVPEKYRSADMNRKIDVTGSGGELDLRFE